MIKVYHKIETRWEPIAEWDAKKFVLVATVPSDSLDYAYEMTNSIHGPWWLNEGVTPNLEGEGFVTIRGQRGCRSTSVGDVMEMGERRWVCDRVGWKPID